MAKIKKSRELRDVTITHVSYVKRGANKKPFFLAKAEGIEQVEFNVRFIAKSDDEKKLLYGIVYEPDTDDAYEDTMTAEEIEKTAHEFVKYYRNIDTEHNLVAGAGSVVESFIAPGDITIGDEVIKSGSWVLVTEASDDAWEAYKAGDITGYSMFGITRQTVSKGEPTMKSWINKLFEAVGIAKSFDETLQARIDEMLRSPWFIMEVMETDFWKNVDWSQTDDERLKCLSEAMKSAASYIDAKVTEISKSDPTPETTATEQSSTTEPETTVEQVAETQAQVTENQEDAPAPTDEPAAEVKKEEPAKEEPANEAEVVEKSQAQVAEALIIETISKSANEAFSALFKGFEANFNERMASLEKRLEETETKLNEHRTDSAVVIPVQEQVVKAIVPGRALI